MVYAYMQCFRKGDEVEFSVEDICRWGGFTPDYKKGRINNKIFDTVGKMEGLNYFTSDTDFATIQSNKKTSAALYTLKLNPDKFDFEEKKRSTNGGYAIIWTDELEKIRLFERYMEYRDSHKGKNFDISKSKDNELRSAFSDIKKTKIKLDLSYSTINTISGKGKPITNVPKLLILLSYIRLHTYKRNRFWVKDNINARYYNPECYFSFLNTIAKKTGLSNGIVSNSLKSLWIMCIIATKEMKRDFIQMKDGSARPHTRPAIMANMRRVVKDENGNYFIDTKYDFDKEINRQIEILLNGKRAKMMKKKEKTEKQIQQTDTVNTVNGKG